MGKTKNKPSKPRELSPDEQSLRAERRAERRELEARGITVFTDERSEEITGRVRLDCFATLLRAHPAEQESVRWLEALLSTADGANAQERRPDHIRTSVSGPPGQYLTQVMLDAGAILAAVTEALSPRDARMLFELLKPDAALLTRWRDVVRRCTGETNDQAQGAAVRAACVNLTWIERNIDRLIRERKERRAAA